MINMASITSKSKLIIRPLALTQRASLSSNNSQLQRFGDDKGSSGWTWEKGGVGMGGKDSGKATEIKPDTGKGKTYQVPEYFAYNAYSYADLEKEMVKQRLPQPKSGLTEFW